MNFTTLLYSVSTEIVIKQKKFKDSFWAPYYPTNFALHWSGLLDCNASDLRAQVKKLGVSHLVYLPQTINSLYIWVSKMHDFSIGETNKEGAYIFRMNAIVGYSNQVLQQTPVLRFISFVREGRLWCFNEGLCYGGQICTPITFSRWTAWCMFEVVLPKD